MKKIIIDLTVKNLRPQKDTVWLQQISQPSEIVDEKTGLIMVSSDGFIKQDEKTTKDKMMQRIAPDMFLGLIVAVAKNIENEYPVGTVVLTYDPATWIDISNDQERYYPLRWTDILAVVEDAKIQDEEVSELGKATMEAKDIKAGIHAANYEGDHLSE